jgi:CDGSH-type Zn-finger protein
VVIASSGGSLSLRSVLADTVCWLLASAVPDALEAGADTAGVFRAVGDERAVLITRWPAGLPTADVSHGRLRLGYCGNVTNLITENNVTITMYENGPLLVRGPVSVLTQDGQPITPGRATVALCRCGHSGRKPFCDGTHKIARFRAPAIPDDRPGIAS